MGRQGIDQPAYVVPFVFCLVPLLCLTDLQLLAEKWLYRFTVDDIALVETAYKYFASLSLTKNDISRETFPIPTDSTLYKELRKSKYEINHGVGLRVLRGLPVDDWEREQQLIIFAGISAYVGERRIKQGIQNVVHLR